MGYLADWLKQDWVTSYLDVHWVERALSTKEGACAITETPEMVQALIAIGWQPPSGGAVTES